MNSRNKMRPTIKTIFAIVTLSQCLSLDSGWAARLFPNGSWQVRAAAVAPELPRVYLFTNYVPPTGRTITVNAGGDLQAAINQAQPGDIISLQAGATFTGNFTLPAKSGQSYIVIRSSTPDANLPAQGTRITPQQSSLLPKIITPDAEAAILTAPGAQKYRLIGLEIGIKAGVQTNYGIVKLGDASASQNTLSAVPQDLIIDRCYIHGNSTGDVSRGIALNSGRTAVIDSFISECHGVGFDTQAICGWNGPGPFKIVNNYLEGAGENFMIGGADPAIPNLIPADIEFRNNYLYKPLRWKVGDPSYVGVHWSVKNIFELKNAERVLVDGNTFENNWQDAQDGFAIVLKCQNQDGGAPWTATRDVTFTNNTVRHSGAGINLLGRDPYQASDQMHRFLIKNNLWDDINGAKWGGTHGRFFQITETTDVTVDHNTIINTGDVITAYGVPSTNFVYTNNIGPNNAYGVKGDGKNSGNETINLYLPGAVFTKNVLAGGSSSIYPAGNFFPPSLDVVGFANLAGGDYRLLSSSTYCNAGTDGKDLGCLVGQPAQTPSPTPTPTPTPALTISNILATSLTASSATIAWATNLFTDGQVEYGTTTGYGQQTALNLTLLTGHVEVLSGLAANTLYNYRIKSRTSNGMLAVSANFTFRTASLISSPSPTPLPTPTPTGDKIPPVLSAVTVGALTSTAASISWVTNEPADSQIEYGKTTAYGQSTALMTGLVAGHVMTLSGLSAGTLYNYRVKSRDAAGNLAVSGNYTFATPGAVVSGSAVPVIWTSLKGLTVIGSVLKKVGGCDGCPTTAVSQQTINSGDGYVEFVAAETGKVRWLGLMQSSKAVSTSNMDFAIVLGNEAAVYEQGRYKSEVPYLVGDVFRMAIEGGTVKYYRNGSLFYTSSLKPVYPLVVAALIDQVGGMVSNAMISAGANATTAGLTLR